jgi:hypothetical protein
MTSSKGGYGDASASEGQPGEFLPSVSRRRSHSGSGSLGWPGVRGTKEGEEGRRGWFAGGLAEKVRGRKVIMKLKDT